MARICYAIAMLFLTSICLADTATDKPSAMLKTISYRGGIVTFSVPKAWKEEYEPVGGGTFYDNRPDSGTLRLNVLSFDSQETPAPQMALKAFPEGSFEILGSGLPFRQSMVQVTENQELLHIHKWDIAVPVQPRSLRLVLFSYTILASQETEAKTKAELALINESIRTAIFSRVAGVAGIYHQD